MAVASVDKALTSFITCPICLEEFGHKNPRILSCLHVLCNDCLQNMIDQKRLTNPNLDRIDCPICKSTTVIPGGQAASLPLYFQFREIEDARKQLRDRHVICQICQSDTHKAVISSYCFTCGSGLCEGCRMDHDSVSPDHKLIKISASAMQYLICREHDSLLTYLCMTCRRAVCSKCRIKGHIKHEVHALTYHRQEAVDDINRFLTSKLETLDKAMSRLDSLQDALETNITNVYKNLEEHRDKMIKMIKLQYALLCDEVEAKHDDIQQGINKSRKYIENVKKLINDTKHWREPVKGIPEATVTNLDHLMADIRQQISATDVNTDIPPELHFTPGTDDICLGEIVDIPGTDDTCLGEIVDMLGTDDICLGEIAEDRMMSSFCSASTLMWQTKTKMWPDVSEIEFIDNNHIIVVTDNEVFVCDEKGQEISHYLSRVCQDMSDEGQLQGVSVNSDKSQVVIVEDKGLDIEGCLHVYLNQDVGWSYKKCVVCECPEWVCFTNSNEFLVSCLHDNTIHKYNQQGRQVMSLQMPFPPRGLCVDSKNRIIVCMWEEVGVYDENGTQTLTLQTTDTEVYLTDVCVSQYDNILVCDKTSKSVLLFDKNGLFIRNLLTLDKSPWKISLYKNKYLAVCDQSDHLFVYEL